MDLATLIGMALGFGLILATMAQGVGIGAFIDTGSIMIVIGGTLASTLIFQRLTHVLSAGKVAAQAFFDKAKPLEDLIPVIIHLAAKARKEGLVSLEGEAIEDDFMALALLTTLYGAILAFLVFGPIAAKLANRTTEEVALKKLAIVGVESILKGDNTMVIQSKLSAFLSPEQRDRDKPGK